MPEHGNVRFHISCSWITMILGANESDDQQRVLLCLIFIFRFSVQFVTTISQFTLS